MSGPAEVIAWVLSVDWLLASDRALALHVGSAGELTCVGSCWGRFGQIGRLAEDGLAADAIDCGASGIIAVDVRRRLPARCPSEADHRRLRSLRSHLALHGVAVLDLVIVGEGGGLSVSGALAFPLQGGEPWLHVHAPGPPEIPPWSRPWAHEDVTGFVPNATGHDVVVCPGFWDDDVV
jgi:hypothetical protein